MTGGPDRAAPRAAIFGTGQLSADLLRVCRISGVEVVAAIAHDPNKVGGDLGQLALGEPNGVEIAVDVAAARSAAHFEVLLYAGLGGRVMLRTCRACIEAGADFITSSGLFDARIHIGPRAARALDARARERGVHVLGTGVNPGLLMDVLPALLASAMPNPCAVEVTRSSDVRPWGAAVLSTEINLGREPDAGAAPVLLGHMRESMHVLAAAMGVRLDRIEASSTPFLAEKHTEVLGIPIEAGRILGFEHRVTGAVKQGPRLTLIWIGRPAEAQPCEIRIASPELGELACQISLPWTSYPSTAARMVNAIGPLRRLAPGLRRPDELQVAHGIG